MHGAGPKFEMHTVNVGCTHKVAYVVSVLTAHTDPFRGCVVDRANSGRSAHDKMMGNGMIRTFRRSERLA